MANPGPIHSTQDIQDQVILPVRVAFGICLAGIRTRLGRSAITLFGVALGIAFLMAVLSGFHIKRAMRSEADLLRDIERRIAVLRSEVGMLKGKRLLVMMAQGNAIDAGFIRALASGGSSLNVLSSSASLPQDASAASAVVLLGNYEPLLAPEVLAAFRGRPVFVFEKPSTEMAERIAAAGGRLRHLGIELRPDELERAAKRERQARYRMLWIVAVSLLITVGCIANAMLMSVTERFREIGTMKCLGALSSFVVKLFLIESLLLGLVGAMLGTLLGAAFSLAAYGYTFGLGNVLAAVSFPTLGAYGVLCVVAGVVMTVVAATYPARVAAKMIPAAALASHV
jgi:ABC-type antimicrobial peptide transport system permease subunit